VGAAIARNLISNAVLAQIGSATVTATLPVSSGTEAQPPSVPDTNDQIADAGQVRVIAIEGATIDAKAAAASAAIGGGIAGVGVSGAGADATNTILTTTEAWIGLRDTPVANDPGSTVTAQGKVTVSAGNTATITAEILSASAALGAGGAAGAASIGTSLARNLIGWTLSGTTFTKSTTTTVRAYVTGSSISAGALDVTATNGATTTAKVGSVSAAIAIGGGALAVSGAGVEVDNRIAVTVAAFVASTPSGRSVTAGPILVRAQDTSTITADALAASIAAAFGTPGTDTAISTGASVARNAIANDVSAYLSSATVTTTTGAITVEAVETATISATSRAASLAGSLTFALSGGGADASAVVTSSVKAYVSGGTISSAGGLTIGATDTTRATAEVQAASVSLGLLAGSAAASVATSTVTPTVEASVTGATITAAGQIAITALSLAYGRAQADGASFSTGVAAADSVATATVSPTVTAFARGTVRSTGAGIEIAARANTNADGTSASTTTVPLGASAEARAASAALISGNGPRSFAYEHGVVLAYVESGSLQAAGAIGLRALSVAAPEATTGGFSGGLVGIGGAFATAITERRTEVRLDSPILGGTTVTVTASNILAPKATARALSGGVLAGSGAEATATARQAAGTTAAKASVAAVAITVSGLVSINATATPGATAISSGGSYGGVAVGASIAKATSNVDVATTVAGGASFGGSLAVTAVRGEATNKAEAVSSAGGLVGANGSDAQSVARGTVTTTVGDGVALPNGDVTVSATSRTKQLAEARGKADGLIAGGASLSTATSDVDVATTLGKVTTSSTRTGALTVRATGRSDNEARTIAGSGGVIAGNAALATLTDTGSATTTLTGPSVLRAGAVTIGAEHASNYTPHVDSTTAAVVGASGAEAKTTNTASTAIVIGAGVEIRGSSIGITTFNSFSRLGLGTEDNVKSSGGGGITAAAAISRTTISGTSTVGIGNGAKFTVTSTPLTGGGIYITASSLVAARDSATLATGGAISGAGVDVSTTADVDNTVTLGTGVLVKSTGDIASAPSRTARRRRAPRSPRGASRPSASATHARRCAPTRSSTSARAPRSTPSGTSTSRPASPRAGAGTRS
jgi:hypothetical protein